MTGSVPGGDDPGLAILLVDDDHDVLGANARLLRVGGHRVVVADTAATALARLAAEPIDVLVTDLRASDADGLTFARSARALRPRLPILFVSAGARVADVVAAMKFGAVDVLEKPVEPVRLLGALADLARARTGAPVEPEAFVVPPDGTSLRTHVRAYEKHLIETALRRHRGSVAGVLESLDINRRTLNDKMSKLGIRRRARRDEES